MVRPRAFCFLISAAFHLRNLQLTGYFGPVKNKVRPIENKIRPDSVPDPPGSEIIKSEGSGSFPFSHQTVKYLLKMYHKVSRFIMRTHTML